MNADLKFTWRYEKKVSRHLASFVLFLSIYIVIQDAIAKFGAIDFLETAIALIFLAAPLFLLLRPQLDGVLEIRGNSVQIDSGRWSVDLFAALSLFFRFLSMRGSFLSSNIVELNHETTALMMPRRKKCTADLNNLKLIVWDGFIKSRVDLVFDDGSVELHSLPQSYIDGIVSFFEINGLNVSRRS